MGKVKHLCFSALVAFSAVTLAVQAKPKPADPTLQIKLRDLLDLAPRKDAQTILAACKRIEDRLAAIEILLMTPKPVPGP